MLRRIALFSVCLVAALCAIIMMRSHSATAAAACTKTWVGPANGSFATADNWSPAGTPTSTDVVCSGAGSSIVTSASQTVTTARLAGTLTINFGTFTISGTTDPNTIGTLHLAGGAQVGDVTVSSSLVWSGGVFSGAGTLTLGASATGSFTGGQLVGPHVFHNLGSFTVVSGQLSMSGTAQLQNAKTMVVNASGLFLLANGGSPTFVNQAAGTLTVNPGAANTATVGVLFTNSGTVFVQKGTFAAGGAFSNFAGTTLTGGAYRLSGTLKLATNGTWTINAAKVTVNSGGAVVNTNNADILMTLVDNAAAGTLSLNRTLSLPGGFTNAGAINVNVGTFTIPSFTQSAGTTTVATGATIHSNDGSIAENGGTIRGGGTVQDDVHGAGKMSPGSTTGAAAVLSLTGAWTPTGGTPLAVDINAVGAPGVASDQLAVAGVATLAGKLAITTKVGFVPPQGQTYTIMTFGSHTGTFSAITGQRPPGVLYEVTYNATNVVLTVFRTPEAPTNVTARSGSTTAATGSLIVSFTAPASDGGKPITGYTATCVSTDGGVTASKTGAASPLTVTGVTTGKSYGCTAAATNSVGTGAPSATTPSVVVGSPAAPTSVTAAKVANGQLSVTFTPGASNGSTITGFTASCVSSNGGAAGSSSGGASPITVTGLTTGKTYTCKVTATNARGVGAPSAASAPVVA